MAKEGHLFSFLFGCTEFSLLSLGAFLEVAMPALFSPHPSLFSCCRCFTETQCLVEDGDLRNVGPTGAPRSGSGQSGSQYGDWQRELAHTARWAQPSAH